MFFLNFNFIHIISFNIGALIVPHMQEAGTVAATEQEERAVAAIRLKRPLHMVRNAEKAPGQTKGPSFEVRLWLAGGELEGD